MIAEHSTEATPNEHRDETTPRALIVGGGVSAALAAKALSEMGIQVTFARFRDVSSQLYYALPEMDGNVLTESLSPEFGNIEIIDVIKAPAVRKNNGVFSAEYEDGSASVYDCLLLAPGLSLKQRSPNLPEETELFTAQMQIVPGRRVAFLLDCEELSSPAAGMAAILVAAANERGGGESVVCFRHAPVLHVFGETLYDAARRTGVKFVRFGEEIPELRVSDDCEGQKQFQLLVKDSIDSENDFVWDCDRVVEVTGPDVSTIPEWAVKMAGSDIDPQGFMLSDSVRSASGCSLSSGVFVVGEATGTTDLIRCMAQAKAAALRAHAWVERSRVKREDEPVSISTACVRCLTCYRVCPHGALSLSPQASRSKIDPSSSFCLECGICASVCPSDAISLRDGIEASVTGLIEELQPSKISETTFVFGCRRSAGLIAQSIQMPDNTRFIAVPCAGSVSEYAIWSTLAAGAGGVLVVGCHHGNCHSHKGTELAASRVERGRALGVPGDNPPRIGYFTIAPNEAARFQRMLKEFLNGHTAS